MCRHLCQAVEEACNELLPSVLCEYLYNLSEMFTRFYTSCQVHLSLFPSLNSFRVRKWQKTFHLLGAKPSTRLVHEIYLTVVAGGRIRGGAKPCAALRSDWDRHETDLPISRNHTRLQAVIGRCLAFISCTYIHLCSHRSLLHAFCFRPCLAVITRN
jgi:hypothetical protein